MTNIVIFNIINYILKISCISYLDFVSNYDYIFGFVIDLQEAFSDYHEKALWIV